MTLSVPLATFFAVGLKNHFLLFKVENVDKNFEDLGRLEASGWKQAAKMVDDAENSPPKRVKKTTAAAAKRKAPEKKGPSKGLREAMAARRKEMAAEKKRQQETEGKAKVRLMQGGQTGFPESNTANRNG